MRTTSAFKKMVYTNKFTRRPAKVLAREHYLGYDFLILSFGTHPTAYVRLPFGHPCIKEKLDDIEIDCHGCLTFIGVPTQVEDPLGFWIGWDYAHWNDRFLGNPNGKSWTTEEIFEEVKNVIEQLKRKETE
jgi:hypothetical protein